ncbi:hypothetical protein TIFTF001_004662 [Ficus carica]|uniref:Uncharacterized protein n=1 Tax=Ficus carica TaxID=3494 RepID=A0AA87ZIC5_FICCA|nr:hypothetical protein TIFTF001_004662 [Ficus carica]
MDLYRQYSVMPAPLTAESEKRERERERGRQKSPTEKERAGGETENGSRDAVAAVGE